MTYPLRPAFLMLAGIVGVAAGDGPGAERVIESGGMIRATIAGKPASIRVDPGAPGLPLVDTAFATRAGLKTGRIGFGVVYGVGSRRFSHATALVAVDAGTSPVKRRVGWPFRPKTIAPNATWTGWSYSGVGDGTISPVALPDPVVRILLHPRRPGEQIVALPLVDGGGLFGRFEGLYAQVMIDGEPMRVRFDPYHPRTLASIGAGIRIARAQGGHVAGPAALVPLPFGVERPARTMTLDRPLPIGPLAIATLGVRTADGAGAASLPDADAAPASVDPDEVVVTAKNKRDPKRDRLSIGADQLDRCSSIVFDKPGKQVRLSCW